MDDIQNLINATPASSALFAVIIVASLVCLFLAPGLIDRLMFRPHGFIQRGELWTPITSGFIHADLPHLLFNGFTFWAFAFPLEAAIGSERFLALYAFGLLVSDAGTWLQHRHQPGYATLGASGAILAVLFAFIVYYPTRSLYIFPLPIPIPAPVFAVCFIAYTWYAARHMPGRVNHDAHLSGAAAGIVFVALTDSQAFKEALQQVFG